MAAEFVELCSDGDLEGVLAALQSGVDVNSKDAHGYTGLFRSLLAGGTAMKQKRTAVANLLLEQEGLDIDIVNYYDETALHWAACSDQNSECLALILAKSTSVNKVTQFGSTALCIAVDRKAVRCVQLLLGDKRTDPNIKDKYGDSPLSLAVKDDLVDCLKLLLSDERTDPNIKDNRPNKRGDSPLMVAVKFNRVACVELLLTDPRVNLLTRDSYERSEEEVAR